eukprot:COSAG06_NODE_4474_length_4217_cov_11.624089_4_plen_106_part_00
MATRRAAPSPATSTLAEPLLVQGKYERSVEIEQNRPAGRDNVNSWSGSRQVDEVCVCVATDALRKLRFSTNHSGHKRASGSRLRARSARAGSDSRAVARRAATFW